MAVRIEEVPNAGEAVLAASSMGSEAVRRAAEAGAAARGEYQRKRAESKDGADEARAGLAMTELRAAHAEETAGEPFAKKMAVWEGKYRAAWEERFAGLNPSRRVRETMGPRWVDFDGRYQVDMRYDAERAELEADKSAMVEGFNTALRGEDFETASALLGHLRRSGHITEAQEEAMWSEGESTVRNRRAQAMLAEDPVHFQREMAESEAAGRSEVFGWMKAEDIARYKGAADAAVRGLRVEKRREIGDGIRAGGITDERQLRELAGNVFEEAQVARWRKSLSADVAYDAQAVGALRTAVANYDARADRDLSGYEALLTQIETTAPKDAQGALAEELHRAYAEAGAGKLRSPAARLRGSLFMQIDALAGSGLLANARGGSAEAAQGLKDEAEVMLRDYPESGAKEMGGWLKDRVLKNAKAAVGLRILGRKESITVPGIGRDFVEAGTSMGGTKGQ